MLPPLLPLRFIVVVVVVVVVVVGKVPREGWRRPIGGGRGTFSPPPRDRDYANRQRKVEDGLKSSRVGRRRTLLELLRAYLAR